MKGNKTIGNTKTSDDKRDIGKAPAIPHSAPSTGYIRHLIIRNIAGEILFDGEDYFAVEKIKSKKLMQPLTGKRWMILRDDVLKVKRTMLVCEI